MSKGKWQPRTNIVILKGILKEDIYQNKLTMDKAKEEVEKDKDGNPIEELSYEGFEEVDIIDQNGDFYFDDYSCFVEDIGEEVANDLGIGDEVFLNAANMRIINDVTDRKKKETYFFAIDQVITMRRPGPQNI